MSNNKYSGRSLQDILDSNQSDNNREKKNGNKNADRNRNNKPDNKNGNRFANKMYYSKNNQKEKVSNNSTNVNLVAGSISNVNTTAGSIADVNRYANEYQISANAPNSPSAGDLWFDTTNNVLKNYNGTIWAGITSNSGIASVVDDTTPQLGGALDGQNNNMSNIGTIDGANLQLDFGTI